MSHQDDELHAARPVRKCEVSIVSQNHRTVSCRQLQFLRVLLLLRVVWLASSLDFLDGVSTSESSHKLLAVLLSRRPSDMVISQNKKISLCNYAAKGMIPSMRTPGSRYSWRKPLPFEKPCSVMQTKPHTGLWQSHNHDFK